ncbi:hypothetical protein VD0004_g5167 [Verticillium dahliae]|nr:hypothetical protein VD0004_g5167 [Verticillium dahliae]
MPSRYSAALSLNLSVWRADDMACKATSVDETETAHHRVTVIIYHCGNTQRKAHCPTLTASRSFKAGDIRRT